MSGSALILLMRSALEPCVGSCTLHQWELMGASSCESGHMASMSLRQCSVFGPVLLFLTMGARTASGIDLTWTAYSDRAHLPQSLHQREELRASLERVDTDNLLAADKMKVRKLKRLLDDVLAESLSESVADENAHGVMRLGGPFVKEHLRPERLVFLVALLLLGGAAVKFSKPIRAHAAATAAAKMADGFVEAERSQAEVKVAKVPLARGEVFPKDVAQALGSRVVSVLMGKASKKLAKEAGASMDTRELATQLVLYYELPQIDIVDKTLRRDRKKLRQMAQALEKAVEDARMAVTKATEKVEEQEKAVIVAEDAKKKADAKKGPKDKRKADEVEDSRTFAEKARVAAATVSAHAELAQQTLDEAMAAEDRPPLLTAMEGSWLHVVTQTWCQASAKLDGVPTASHVHVWARDHALRTNAEEAYRKITTEKSFLA